MAHYVEILRLVRPHLATNPWRIFLGESYLCEDTESTEKIINRLQPFLDLIEPKLSDGGLWASWTFSKEEFDALMRG